MIRKYYEAIDGTGGQHIDLTHTDKPGKKEEKDEQDAAFENFIKSITDAKDKFKEMTPEQLKDMMEVLLQISASYMMPLFYSMSLQDGMEAAFNNTENGDKFILSFRKDGRDFGSLLSKKTQSPLPSQQEAGQKVELFIICPHCNGDGYTAEHDIYCDGSPDYCGSNCPVQVQCETCQAKGYVPYTGQSSQSGGGQGNEAVELKIAELLKITDEFIFPAYYSHEDKVMWKIENVFTSYQSETLVLCGLDEGIEKALDLAIYHIGKKRTEFYQQSKSKQ